MVCKSQSRIPVSELWEGFSPFGFEKGNFVILRGYIDESGNDGDLFVLACLISNGKNWFHLENEWLNLLDAKNRDLKKAKRKLISRFHASDCSCRLGDFKGWSTPEQIEFTKALLAIFNKYEFNQHSYAISLKELSDAIPAVRRNPEGFAYVLLFSFILIDIAKETLKFNKGSLVSLFHDHCKYNGALQNAYYELLSKPSPIYKDRHRFVSLAPMQWQHCVPLQPADLIAYENFKELERYYVQRNRRKSLHSIVTEGRLGGSSLRLHAPALDKLKEIFDRLDNSTKNTLLEMSRIKARHTARR